MCQYFIKGKGRQCRNKKEPYCHLHTITNIDDNVKSKECIPSIDKTISNKNKIENIQTNDDIECPICYESCSFDKIIYTSCKHHICRSCLIKSGSTKCCMCRKDIESDIMKKDKDTLDLILFIKSKDEKIEKLDNEINTLRSIFTILGF